MFPLIRKDEPLMEQEAADGTKTKRIKHPIPDGYVTPTQLVQHLAFAGLSNDPTKEAKDEDKIVLGPQSVYSWTRTIEDFPTTIHTDSRTIINRKAGLAWVKKHLDEIQAKQNRRAANATKRKERLIKGALTANRTFALAASGE